MYQVLIAPSRAEEKKCGKTSAGDKKDRRLPQKQPVLKGDSKETGDASALNDLQHLHGTCFGAQTAGNALGSKFGSFGQPDDLHGADLDALAAGLAEFLVDHIYALGVLGNGVFRAVSGTFAALDAYEGGGGAALHGDAQKSPVGVHDLVIDLGAGGRAGQAGHTFDAFFNGQFLHDCIYS